LPLSEKDVEKACPESGRRAYQLCSRFIQRLNVLTVRFAFSFAAAPLERRFEHPYLRKAHSLLFVPQGFGRGGQPTKFRHTREGGYPFSKTSRWIPD
jgi:hypothetical protein